ncbi:MAG: hypothetical protein FWE15_22150 [Actinomycetia bacterium]|nr:hypothetical protein [Actinomycetes bacterium]
MVPDPADPWHGTLLTSFEVIASKAFDLERLSTYTHPSMALTAAALRYVGGVEGS